MEQYQSDLANPAGRNITSKMMGFMITGLSFIVLIMIFYWTMNLYERDIEDLPIISALQDEIRVRPETTGGTEIDHKGLSVNGVLEEDKSLVGEASEIIMAPKQERLLPAEKSPALDLSTTKDLSSELIANSITSALETLLGIEVHEENDLNERIELHIASYSTADEANAHWFLLQQLNSDLLENYSHQVVKVHDNEKEIFRLRIRGFKNLAAAQGMCAQLVDRGEDCVPAESQGLK